LHGFPACRQPFDGVVEQGRGGYWTPLSLCFASDGSGWGSIVATFHTPQLTRTVHTCDRPDPLGFTALLPRALPPLAATMLSAHCNVCVLSRRCAPSSLEAAPNGYRPTPKYVATQQGNPHQNQLLGTPHLFFFHIFIIIFMKSRLVSSVIWLSPQRT